MRKGKQKGEGDAQYAFQFVHFLFEAEDVVFGIDGDAEVVGFTLRETHFVSPAVILRQLLLDILARVNGGRGDSTHR